MMIINDHYYRTTTTVRMLSGTRAITLPVGTVLLALGPVGPTRFHAFRDCSTYEEGSLMVSCYAGFEHIGDQIDGRPA